MPQNNSETVDGLRTIRIKERGGKLREVKLTPVSPEELKRRREAELAAAEAAEFGESEDADDTPEA